VKKVCEGDTKTSPASASQPAPILTPGRYVGAAEQEEDDEPFNEKMQRLVTTLNCQFAESAKLEKAIKANLRGLGYQL
jgi:type I restriction enzyme M protein